MEETYKCEKCKKTEIVIDGIVPECCGEPMKIYPLEVCTQPANAEHARPMEDEEPCDDGRSG